MISVKALSVNLPFGTGLVRSILSHLSAKFCFNLSRIKTKGKELKLTTNVNNQENIEVEIKHARINHVMPVT